jgi:hypothetical protein
MGTLLTNMEGGSLTADSYGMIKRDIKRDVKMPCKRESLSIGAQLGNLERVVCQDLLREKDRITGFPSWTQRTLRF